MKINLFKKNEIDMCNGNLFLKIIIFSIPLVLSGILQLLYNAADLIVVGNFGSNNSLAAIGNTGALINLIVNVFMGLSVGANVSLAKCFGAKDISKARKVVSSSIILSLLAGVAVGIFGVCCSHYFLKWMGTPDDVIELSSLYIRIYFIGMPFNLLYNFGAALLRATGDTKRPLIYLAISGLINVGLNLLFVLGFHLDVMGVAIATITSQFIASILVVLTLIKNNGYAFLDLKNLRLYKHETLEIVRIGLPAGIQGSIFSISNVLIQSSVNSFGSIAMNGNSAAQNIEGFTYVSMNSIYHAALSFTGQNYGARKINNIKKIFVSCLIIVITIGLVMGGCSYLFGNTLLRFYTSNADSIKVGIERMFYIALFYFLCGIMDVACGMLRGLGYALIPMIVSLIGACGFRIVWIYTYFKFNHTLSSLYVSYPLSWALTFVVQLLLYLILRKRAFDKCLNA